MSTYACDCTANHSHECAIFKCSVCNRPAIVSAPGDEPTYCPLHCPEHDYRHEPGEGKRCTTCHAEPPHDWGCED